VVHGQRNIELWYGNSLLGLDAASPCSSSTFPLIGENFARKSKQEVHLMQTQLSPAHADYGKVDFAELEDRIRKRAYQLYERREYVHGHALDDWLEAKAEVLGVTKGESYLDNMTAKR
jgi:Protein of unknown function (DUF2934)